MAAFHDRVDAYEPDAAPDAGSTPEPEPVVASPDPAPNAESVSSQPATDTSVTNTNVETQPVSKPKTWKERYGSEEAADREAFALEQRAAAMAAELKELKAKTAPPPAVEAQPAHPAPEPAPHPDVSTLDNSLRAIDKDIQSVEAQVGTLNTRYVAANKALNSAVDVLSSPESDFDAINLARAQHVKAKSELAEIGREYQGLSVTHRALIADKRITQFERSQVEQRVQSEQARAADDKKRRDTEELAFVTAVRSTIEAVTVEGNEIPEKFRDRFKAYAQKALMSDLNLSKLTPADLPAYLKAVRTEFADLIKDAHVAQSAEYGKQKAKDAAVAAPDGSKAVATPTKTSGFKSRAEVKDYLASMTGS